MKVWRERDRIRSEAGFGYSDSVSDDTIREHLAEHRRAYAAAARDIPFCEAVLALRAEERTAGAVEGGDGG